MIDVYTLVPPMIKDILRVEPRFPDTVAKFPLGILTPLDGGSGDIISGEERYALVMFQLDVYDTDLKRCSENALAISRGLIARGFVRTSGGSIRENRLHRQTMTFSAKIDEHTGLIYRR